MELADADLKISAPGKWQHFQKYFFYRLVGRQPINGITTYQKGDNHDKPF
jgi:hypothetical protein